MVEGVSQGRAGHVYYWSSGDSIFYVTGLQRLCFNGYVTDPQALRIDSKIDPSTWVKESHAPNLMKVDLLLLSLILMALSIYLRSLVHKAFDHIMVFGENGSVLL